jgi:hypothetical protein
MAVAATPPKHVCEGVNCPHVVDTGEALVCALTGVCVGDLFVVCFDYTSSSTQFNVSTTVPATSIVKSAVLPSAAASASCEDAKGAREQLYAECYRVVSKMLVDDPDVVGKRNAKLVTRAMKQATGVTKKRRDGKMRLMPVVFEFVRLMQQGAKSGETEAHVEDLKTTVARRCAACCAMCFRTHPDSPSAKVKPAYMCLAVLYMLRGGFVVKGVRVCDKDEAVAARLPSLNSLSLFGYQKSKYTKAERFLLESIAWAMFTSPLHEVKI